MSARLTTRRGVMQGMAAGVLGAAVQAPCGLAAAAEIRPAAAASAAPPIDAGRPLRDVGPGRKFAASGQVQRWPGCTLICHVPRPTPAFDVLCEARDLLRADPVHRHKLTWLPEHSYHMTVCDLLNVSHRKVGDWPPAVPLDAPLDAACAHVADVLRELRVDGAQPFRLVVDDATVHDGFMADGYPRSGVPWRPIDAAEQRRLRALRDRVFDAIGIRHAGHADYRFHTTLAYPLQWLSADEAVRWRRSFLQAMRHIQRRLPVIELGAPEFCLFDTMYVFDTQFTLAPA